MFFSHLPFNCNQLVSPGEVDYLRVKKKILNQIKKKNFGFINILKKNQFSEIYRLSKKLKRFENVVFLGTGGSSLGGKTLVSLNNKKLQKKKPNLFFVENVDSVVISNLIKKINLMKTVVVVVSKSGQTFETLAQYFYIAEEMRKKKIALKNRFVIITEKRQSNLKNIQEIEGFDYYQHEKNIGGRFSVFSIVGLLPAALAGLDIKLLCDGAKSFLSLITSSKKKFGLEPPLNFDLFFLVAYAQYKLICNGKNITVLMPYADCLQNFSSWFRQLWAESIGKKGLGSTPINALGTVDQHSQLQLYLDGPSDKFFTFLGRTLCSKKKYKKHVLKGVANDTVVSILNCKTLDELMNAEMYATISTIYQKGFPGRIITLDLTDEKAIGSLMMFFFLETIFTCYLLDIDPFNQPAVEEVKKLTEKILLSTEYCESFIKKLRSTSNE